MKPSRSSVVHHDAGQALKAVLNEELDIEIGLRNRLKETVESRLSWALVLQDALEKHQDGDGASTLNSASLCISLC